MIRDKITRRDLIIGNYFLDRGDKILRVDDIVRTLDKSYKIEHENIIIGEVSLLSPEGIYYFHPYTEDMEFLREVEFTTLSEKVGISNVFNGFDNNNEYNANGFKILFNQYDCYFFTIFNNENLLVHNESGFFTVNHIVNIVYETCGVILTLKDNLLLKKI